MPPYSQLVSAFDQGDVLFGLSPDLMAAQAALREAYGDGASFWGAFSRMGRKKNEKARAYNNSTDVKLQSDLTNAVADPGVLATNIKSAIPSVRAARGGAPLTGRPMQSSFGAPRVKEKLPNESKRGLDFGAFLDGHQKFDPKLMGGRLKEDGSFSPLGDREKDRQWIAQSRRQAFLNHLTTELDSGAVLHLTNARTHACRPKGQNKALVEERWAEIDWAQYDMWSALHDSHIGSVVNYKIWKRTSKAGLEFQTTVRDRTVHFLLDTFMKGDGMKSAATKGGAHGKSITAGELRWLYRNWDNPKVSGNVRFWKVDCAVGPPWELAAYYDDWKAYKPAGGTWGERSQALTGSLGVIG